MEKEVRKNPRVVPKHVSPNVAKFSDQTLMSIYSCVIEDDEFTPLGNAVSAELTKRNLIAPNNGRTEAGDAVQADVDEEVHEECQEKLEEFQDDLDAQRRHIAELEGLNRNLSAWASRMITLLADVGIYWDPEPEPGQPGRFFRSDTREVVS